MRIFRRRRAEDDEIIEGEVEDIQEEAETAEQAEPIAKPRRGFFRRRQTEAAPGEPPLERVYPDIPTPDETPASQYAQRGEARRGFKLPRLRLPRLIVWGEVRPGLLLLAIGLVTGGVFWTLYNLDATSRQAEAWWPAVLLGFGLIWALVALVSRRAAAFLAATALVGISISLLLSAQDLLEWRETLAGTVLITVGVGIVARGFLLREGSVAR
jgi:hypothetical protein